MMIIKMVIMMMIKLFYRNRSIIAWVFSWTALKKESGVLRKTITLEISTCLMTDWTFSLIQITTRERQRVLPRPFSPHQNPRVKSRLQEHRRFLKSTTQRHPFRNAQNFSECTPILDRLSYQPKSQRIHSWKKSTPLVLNYQLAEHGIKATTRSFA